MKEGKEKEKIIEKPKNNEHSKTFKTNSKHPETKRKGKERKFLCDFKHVIFF